MNRAFKIDFHNGEADEKTIVSMSVSVKNGKRFKALDDTGKQHLIENLVEFKKKVEAFTAEVIKSISNPSTPTNDK